MARQFSSFFFQGTIWGGLGTKTNKTGKSHIMLHCASILLLLQSVSGSVVRTDGEVCLGVRLICINLRRAYISKCLSLKASWVTSSASRMSCHILRVNDLTPLTCLRLFQIVCNRLFTRFYPRNFSQGYIYIYIYIRTLPFLGGINSILLN